MQRTTAKIDRAGRVVIPSEIRQAMHLEADSSLQLRLVNGVLEIEPLATQAEFKRKGRLVVAQGPRKAPGITQAQIERVRQDLYADRADQTIAQSRKK